MSYVIGVDLGTSAVKVLLVNRSGEVCGEVSKSVPLIQEQPGYSEQRPEDWVEQTIAAIQELVQQSGVSPANIEGISYSGQMHGLVLLDQQGNVLRNAILWNDTRTTSQCRRIEQTLGDDLLTITKNKALEGFTLPKLLWVQEHEPEVLGRSSVFLLPKDYVRYRMTGQLHMDYSDAAGTLLLNVLEKKWSEPLCDAFQLDRSICPPLVDSFDCVGELLSEIAAKMGLSPATKVFAGAADNACGAVGSGILSPGVTMCSIGTSGVVLSYEGGPVEGGGGGAAGAGSSGGAAGAGSSGARAGGQSTVAGAPDFQGKVHFFNHAQQDAFYIMGVTLAAGYSLSWFKHTFAPQESFEKLLEGIGQVPAGSRGLLFTPYLVGERTPHADAQIRGSFIGMDSSHRRDDFARAVLEGITFSLHETVEMLRAAGKTVDRIISIGGGAKNEVWLQMQADIFNAKVIRLQSEQGPAMGAAMLAAFGCGWYDSLQACAEQFIKHDAEFTPNPAAVAVYKQLFPLYQQVYTDTAALNRSLSAFRGG